MGRNIDQNTSKNLSSKYSQKLIDHANQSATDALKTASKREIQKIIEATGQIKIRFEIKLLINLQGSQKLPQK